MSLPPSAHSTFTPAEISFLAENETITILPRYTMNGVTLIGTKLPNLRAMNRQEVPLWLALLLKSQDKCNIIMPDWFRVEVLQKKYDAEIKYKLKFSDLPWHWLEVSKVLLDKASDDIADPPHQLRSLIQDLREIRQVKARSGIRELNEAYLELKNLSLIEINEVRPFIATTMDQLRKIKDSTKPSQPISIDDDDNEYDDGRDDDDDDDDD